MDPEDNEAALPRGTGAGSVRGGVSHSARQPGIRRIGVFCGSAEGNDPAFAAAAAVLGRLLAETRIGLVYGGARVGIMGIVADAAMSVGGEVIGVLPRGLEKREIAHGGLTRLHIVDSMHERKALMSELSDAFVALPGGVGTLEEFFEAWTWGLLGIHKKPCGLLNTQGFYEPLLDLMDHIVGHGFLRAQHREIVLVDNDPGRLLDALQTYFPPQHKWDGDPARELQGGQETGIE